jgi:enterochelin esterase-like enzyme
MGLMSGTTMTVAVFVLIAVTLATVLIWSRVTGSGWLVWPLRIGSLLSCQAGAVVLCALVLNSTFGFYASWSELLGRTPASGQATASVGSQDVRLHDELYRNFLDGQGTIVRIAMPGTTSHVSAPAGAVYLPPQYGDPAFANRTFPVVQLFAGYPGGPSSWVHGLGIASVLDQAIGSGSTVPFIAVMAEQNGESRLDSECVNSVGGMQMDTYLTYDVRAAVRSAFRASQQDSQWTAMGYSTGGYCAINLALRHPGMFHAAASMAGDNHTTVDWTTGPLFGKDVLAREQNNDVWRLSHLPQPNTNLLLVDSARDPSSRVADIGLMKQARAPLQVYSLSLSTGGHNAQTWDAELPTCLAWLSRYVSAPLATVPTADGKAPVLNPYLPRPAVPGHNPERHMLAGHRAVAAAHR